MQFTVVVADFHPEGESLAAAAEQLPRLPAFEALLRYGRRERFADGWRAWLARSFERPDLAARAPASVAAAALADPLAGAWIAAPVHLLAGIDHHLRLHPAGLLRGSRRSVPRCSPAALPSTFGDSGWALRPLAGSFLLQGLTVPGPGDSMPSTARDPALARANMASAIPQGRAARALRAATAEIEMWLHEHPLNQQGSLAVNGLWLWGGEGASDVQRTTASAPLRVFGVDAFLSGLCRLYRGAGGCYHVRRGAGGCDRGWRCHRQRSGAACAMRRCCVSRSSGWRRPLAALRAGALGVLPGAGGRLAADAAPFQPATLLAPGATVVAGAIGRLIRPPPSFLQLLLQRRFPELLAAVVLEHGVVGRAAGKLARKRSGSYRTSDRST